MSIKTSMKMRIKRWTGILCLLVAGMGCISAALPQGGKTDKYGGKESASVQLLAKPKLRGSGRVTFKCRVVRYGPRYRLLAKVLRNDSAVHIVKPGVRLMLADGDSVVLKPERTPGCCSDWADGRWYNASFRLSASDVINLRAGKVVRVAIPSDQGEIRREVSGRKQTVLAELLQSIERD